jgi:formylglycine-generating enzyme required for sulfatase activity
MSPCRSWVAVAIAASAAVRPAGAQAGTLRPYRDSLPGTLVGFDMVPVPGGTVTVDGVAAPVAPFWIGRTEVTWDAYDVFAFGLDRNQPGATGGADAVARPTRPYGAPDRGFGHRGYPVISVTRAAAHAFCAWLSATTGRRYRLPSEAEWLHAADLAVGPGAPAADRLDRLAWHAANSGQRTHPVGSKQADALGLRDLLGNAAEWVIPADSAPVVRGGSYRDPPPSVGAGARAIQDPSWNERDPQFPKSRWWLSDGPFIGFRIVREPEPERP